MDNAVKVWVAELPSGELSNTYSQINEDECWFFISQKTDLKLSELRADGWTVRPMRLLDGHGEQAFDPKLFDAVREIVKFRGYYVDEKLRTASITTELIFKTLSLPLPNASSELGEQEGDV